MMSCCGPLAGCFMKRPVHRASLRHLPMRRLEYNRAVPPQLNRPSLFAQTTSITCRNFHMNRPFCFRPIVWLDPGASAAICLRHALVNVLVDDHPWFLARWTVRGPIPAGAVRLAQAAGCRTLPVGENGRLGASDVDPDRKPELAGMIASNIVCADTNHAPAMVDT